MDSWVPSLFTGSYDKIVNWHYSNIKQNVQKKEPYHWWDWWYRSKTCHSKCLCGMQVILCWGKKKIKTQEERLRKKLWPSYYLPQSSVFPGIELSPEISAENVGQQWWGQLWWVRTLCISFSVQGSANTCLANTCLSISLWIAFLPFKVPNLYPQHSLLSPVGDDI